MVYRPYNFYDTEGEARAVKELFIRQGRKAYYKIVWYVYCDKEDDKNDR
jgi:hypothetical protein